MCFCLVHFHIDSLLPGFCWLLERGVAKSLLFCWQSCKTVPMPVCHLVPGCFVPTPDGWVGKGSDRYSVPGTGFWLPDTSCFYVLQKSLKNFVIILILGEWIYFVLAVLKCIVSSPVLLCVSCLAPASLLAFEEPFLSTAPSCLQRALKQ